MQLLPVPGGGERDFSAWEKYTSWFQMMMVKNKMALSVRVFLYLVHSPHQNTHSTTKGRTSGSVGWHGV